MTRCRVTERFLDRPDIPFELKQCVEQQRKKIGQLETALGTAERTVRNQQVENERLKRRIAELESRP